MASSRFTVIGPEKDRVSVGFEKMVQTLGFLQLQKMVCSADMHY